MSASRERKKRLELAAQGLSPKQIKKEAEKKKKKKNTIIGIIILAVVLAIAVACIYGLVIRPNSEPRKTVALHLGEQDVSATEFGYYYYDTVNNFYQNYGGYLSYIMSDAGAPIDEQIYDEETGKTWADYFIETAAKSAQYDYAACNAAQRDGFTLSADGEQRIKDSLESLKSSVKEQGFKSLKEYFVSVYGKGANEKSYYDYQVRRNTASEYAAKIEDERTYTAEQIQAKDDENPNLYTNVTYRYYYISSADYKEESAADDVVDYVEEGDEDAISQAEEEANAIALEAAQDAANKMANDAKGNEDKYIALTREYATEEKKENYADDDATLQTSVSFDNVSTYMKDWLYDDTRKEGDTGVVSDGGSGFYVLYFKGLDMNEYNMVNVRQILFQPEVDADADGDGTNDTSSDEALADAKAKAEELLAKWKSGEATEESFAALSDEQTGGEDGGLYENLYHGEMVESFNDWCFDEKRQPGDVEIVETQYGYHVIYFAGEGESYRKSMIIDDLKEADYDEWYEDIIKAYDFTLDEAGTAFLHTDLVLGSSETAN